MACSISYKCLTMWHKVIHFTSCMYAHYLVKFHTRVKTVTKHSVISHWCLQKKLVDKGENNFLSALSTSFIYTVTMNVRSPLTLTHCQMMTPLLYCTYMMVWSVVTPSINSREYCVYYINNVSLTIRQNAYHHYLFQANNCFCRASASFCWKLCEITVFFSQFCLSQHYKVVCVHTPGEVDSFAVRH